MSERSPAAAATRHRPLDNGDRRLLARVTKAIWGLEPGAQVILYGSRARGDAGPDSDWDLLALLDGAVDFARDEALCTCVRNIAWDTNTTISLIVHSHAEWESAKHTVTPFHANVVDDGIDLATLRPAWPDHTPRFTEAEMAEAREQVAAEWMERARSAIAASKTLAAGGFWNECVSRLYYGCFDAVRALLLVRGFRFSRHAHVQSLFHQHLVQTGVIPVELGKLYNTLLEGRGRADYEAFARFDAETVQPWMDGAQRLIGLIAGLLAPGPGDQSAGTPPESDENR